ncbi:hypothetical protein D3C81_1240150 [compost metagenome]
MLGRIIIVLATLPGLTGRLVEILIGRMALPIVVITVGANRSPFMLCPSSIAPGKTFSPISGATTKISDLNASINAT